MLRSAVVFGLAVCVRTVSACMTVAFPVEDGATIVARTMELGAPLGETLLPIWKVVTHARGTVRTPTANALGFIAVQVDIPSVASFITTAADGMNEVGLTVACQTLRGAVYQSANSSVSGGGPTIKFQEVLPLLLGSSKTVAEAVTVLRGVTVVDDPVVAALIGRMHWSVIDESGGSIVLEYIDGALRVHDNREVGVLTNDPDYRFQLQYLNQFGPYPTQLNGIAPVFPFAVQSEIGAVPSEVGHGFNTRFLPGGYSPPDRFVRTFLLKQTATHVAPPKDTDAGIELATGLLNNVHIVRGSVARLSHTDSLELTQWALIKLPKQRQYLYRTYGNMQWKRLTLSTMSLDEPSRAPGPVPLFVDGLGIKDVTPPPREVEQRA